MKAFVLGALVGIVILLGYLPPKADPVPNEVEEVIIISAYGIVSPCGLFGVIHVYDDGTSELFDAQNPEELAEEQAVKDLLPSQRTVIVVPCPSIPAPAGLIG